jgi:hypothetical protein
MRNKNDVRSKVATVFTGFLSRFNQYVYRQRRLPGMSRALNASVSELAWVSNGYMPA